MKVQIWVFLKQKRIKGTSVIHVFCNKTHASSTYSGATKPAAPTLGTFAPTCFASGRAYLLSIDTVRGALFTFTHKTIDSVRRFVVSDQHNQTIRLGRKGVLS